MLTKLHYISPTLVIYLLAVSASTHILGSSLTIAYLQQVSDKYQRTVDVYTDADAAGNHFAARGEFDNLQADRVATMDEISTAAPCFGVTCITATFDPAGASWGGWYFLNGVLGPTARQPVPNWGDQPNAGYDLTGASALQFWARGLLGGEVVHFFAFGVGNTAPPFQPYPDSSAKVELPQGAVVLSTTWTQYQIPLTGLNMHYVLGGFGWVANAVEGNRLQPPITFYMDNIQYVKARPNDPRFLVSYETIKSTNPFDAVLRNAAYVYDNAVSLIAMVASGDLPHAQTIADAIVYAQRHDRFFTDGRLRNAYQGGDISLPPGWLPNNLANTVRMPGWYDPGRTTWFEDETQVSSNTGNVAWAGLALLDMWEITKNRSYLNAAQALGNWVWLNARERRGGAAGELSGFTGGYDGWENAAAAGASNTLCASGVLVNGQCERLYKSTEHNIDLYSMFSRLYLADGDAQWADAAQRAKHFFLSMWDPQGGKFWTGTTEDGATVSTDVIPLDIQAWGLLALGAEEQAYLQSLAYVESHHRTSLGYGFKQDGGNSCGDNTWFEGTSQVAVAYLLSGNQAKWQSILDGVHSAQTPNGGVPATDGACLNTGFTLNDGSPWEYFPRVHVGATGWLGLAENGINPYRPELYSPALITSSSDFGSQYVGVQGPARTVLFSNPGVGPLSIRSVALTGANASDFQLNNNCGTSLGSGATCTITISFVPSALGARTSALTITESSDPAMVPTPISINLTGKGVPPQSSFVLTLNSVPQVGGTITATPTSAGGAYPAGATVCLTAVPAAGWSFAGWSGDSLDSNGCLIMTANKSVMANFSGAPTIQLTSIPQYGSLNGTITGTVTSAAASNYQIAALIFLSGRGWFSKPYCASPATTLNSDGSFAVQLTTGGVDQFATRIALLVVPSSLSVSCYTAASGIPLALLQQAAAQFIVNRPNPNEREIGFSGQRWAVKASTVPIGPGNCVFSDSSDNVSVDGNGSLHLRVVNDIGNWSCAEIYSRAAVGYGVYRWTIASAPTLDPSVVFGNFTWADAELNARELDVEFGFDKPGDPTNAQFVLQPASQPGNLQRVSIPTSSPITLKMTWLPDTLLFQAFVGVDDHGVKVQEWQYQGAPPPADSQYQNFRFNLWLNGAPPSSGTAQEVIINSYEYEPFVADPALPALDGLVSDASFLPGAAPGMDFALFGRNFSPQAVTASSPLPLSLGGVSVAVNGVPAPLFFVSPNQINGQIPYLAPLGPSLVSVSVNGRAGQMQSFTNSSSAPGIFVGLLQNCIVQNQDQTLNSLTNPAGPGSIITAYLTGLGQVDNPVPSGSAAPLSPLSRALLAATAEIDGKAATMDFLGLVPGLVGVGQANIHVPTNVSGGPKLLVVTVGGVASNSCSLSIVGGTTGAPTIVTSSLANGAVAVAYSQTLSASGGTPPYSSWTVSAGTLPPGLALNASSGVISGKPFSAVGSPFGFSVIVRDSSGSTSSAQSLSIVIVQPAAAPTISSVSPTSGLTAGGTAVSIFGSNFVSGATVNFGNANATVSQLLSGQILAITPPGTGTVSITVKNPDGQSGILSNAFTYQPITTNNPTIQSTTHACTVSGTVSGVNPPSAFGIVVYAFTNQYYVQACDFDPPASINSDGTWGPVQSHNGVISAILVRQGYIPASILQSLPQPDGVNVFAVSNVAGTLTGCDVARCPAQ